MTSFADAIALAGIAVSLLLVPLFTYWRLVLDPVALSDASMLVPSLVALVPGFLMGGIALLVAARG